MIISTANQKLNNSLLFGTTSLEYVDSITVTGNDDLVNFSYFTINTAWNSSKDYSNNASTRSQWTWLNGGSIQIAFYTIILLLAVVGNLLVISTLVQNRRMRTVTNIFLLNLAISDILLGVLCMPVTLVGTLLRHFIFGEFLCKLIPFLQATSVAVSSWTLVAISCERYCAIIYPLRSRSWQTVNHAYKTIGFIWLSSLVCMAPIFIFSQLIPTSQGLRKCREDWPHDALVLERAYNILLDLILLILPLIILCAAYFLIIKTLYVGMKMEGILVDDKSHHIRDTTACETRPISTRSLNIKSHQREQRLYNKSQNQSYDESLAKGKIYPNARAPRPIAVTSYRMQTKNYYFQHVRRANNASSSAISIKPYDSVLRRSNVAKNLENKKRVVKMLFVLVLEFFICWTPLYVINTITLFDPNLVYQNLDYTTISFLQLLAYSSSCCNPITYGFMNAGFRQAFIDLNISKKICHKPKQRSTVETLEMQSEY